MAPLAPWPATGAYAGRVIQLRCVTYLSPSLPLELFEVVVTALRARLGVDVSLRSVTERSGPLPGADPFSADEADLGFVCTPSYAWLSAPVEPPIELLPVALVPDDPRCAGRPVFFSDLVVRADSAAASLTDLRGSTWAYNDPCSQSGYFSVLRRLDDIDEDASQFFGSRLAAGTHLEAMLHVAQGTADLASIDSNVLRLHRASLPDLRVVESLGPYPIQPIVVRRDLSDALREEVTAVFLELGDALHPFGFLGAGSVTPDDYRGECRALRGHEPGGPRS